MNNSNSTTMKTRQDFTAQESADLICSAFDFIVNKYGRQKGLSVDVQYPLITGSTCSVNFVAYEDLYGPTIYINDEDGIPEHHRDGHNPTLENGGIKRTQEELDKLYEELLIHLSA